jgi:subtilisin family serine protease
MVLKQKLTSVLFIFLFLFIYMYPYTSSAQDTDELNDYEKYHNRNFNHFGYFGNGVTVAVIDTGLNFNHSDFENRVVNQINLLNRSELAVDLHSHGTHMSGIILGSGLGLSNFTGMAPNATLIVVKAISDNGYTSSDLIAEGIEWLRNQNASVINLSFSTTDLVSDGSDHLSKLVNNISLSSNKVFIVASGNIEDLDKGNILGSPAAATEVITVGAADLTGDEIIIPSFSIHGPRTDGLQKPEVVAPGIRIASTYYEKDYYGWADGTSQSTAYVSGLVVLMKEINPNLNNREIKFILRETAIDLLEPGIDDKTGWGLVDPEKALLYTISFNQSLPYATFTQPKLMHYNWTSLLDVELEFINQTNIKDVVITIKQNDKVITTFDYAIKSEIPILTSGNYSIIANITDLQNNHFSLIKTLIISYNNINPNLLMFELFAGLVISLIFIAIYEKHSKRMKFYNEYATR